MQKYLYFVQGASMKEKQEGKKRKADRFEIRDSSLKRASKASFYCI